MSELPRSSGSLRRAVDAALGSFLADRRAALPEAAALIDEIERLLNSGGKRIRPAFCFWGHRAAGGQDGDAAVRAAASLELLHTFAIVHDDIMDSSEERRGVPTVHVRHGLNVALLVGDLALVLADALFVGSGFGAPDVTRAFEWYSRMRQQVIAGQYLDVELAREPLVTEERARWVAVLKSGRYSIEHPLAIGASLAGARPDLLERIRSFGAPLGEAFQLRDDLLGTFGERSSVGKPVDSDIREGKRHVLYAKALASLPPSERSFLVARWGGGSELGEEEVEQLRGLIESSGARAATERLVTELTERALGALKELALEDEVHAALEDLAHSATTRRC
ncbi:MAG: polyprenyl synthetase family protein [Actinomycetota bacterium]